MHGDREGSSTAVGRREHDGMEKLSGDYHDDVRMEHRHRAASVHAEDRSWGGNDRSADLTRASWRPW